jgi:hypothetical protein
MTEVITLTKLELTEAFAAWYEDYKNDPTKFEDYDTKGYDGVSYAVGSTNMLIKYINKIKGE